MKARGANRPRRIRALGSPSPAETLPIAATLSRMAKRRQEEVPPLLLPPAKLFLDDLEEVVRTEAAKREGIVEASDTSRVVCKVSINPADAAGSEPPRESGKQRPRSTSRAATATELAPRNEWPKQTDSWT